MIRYANVPVGEYPKVDVINLLIASLNDDPDQVGLILDHNDMEDLLPIMTSFALMLMRQLDHGGRLVLNDLARRLESAPI